MGYRYRLLLHSGALYGAAGCRSQTLKTGLPMSLMLKTSPINCFFFACMATYAHWRLDLTIRAEVWASNNESHNLTNLFKY